MNRDFVAAVTAAVNEWPYLQTLPERAHGFEYRRLLQDYDDIVDIFAYVNQAEKCRFTVYYHAETKEYKVRLKIGLTEFCDIKYIAADLPSLEKMLNAYLETTLAGMVNFSLDNIDSIVVDKQILTWDYLDRLQLEIAGFKLFIRPDEPVRVLNGSYIIIDYSDFMANSNFTIYYNILRDDFFGELKIAGVPEITYAFDSRELSELAAKLDEGLEPLLVSMRRRITTAI